MVGSHMKDVSEQDRGRDPSPPTRRKKDKSSDDSSSFEEQIAKLELGMSNTKGDANLLEQRIEGAMGNLRE